MGMRRAGWTLVGMLCAALVLCVVADRALVRYAEHRAAARVAHGVAAVGADPRVAIHGFPFVTQLPGGVLDHVTVRSERVAVRGFDLGEVRLELYDVEWRGARHHVRHLQVVGTLDVAGIAAALQRQGVPVANLAVHGPRSPGQAGTVSFDRTYLGIRATIELAVQYDGAARQLVLHPVGASVAGLSVGIDALPAPIRSAIDSYRLDVGGFGVTDLPYVSQLDAVRVTDAGLEVSGHGDGVDLREGAPR